MANWFHQIEQGSLSTELLCLRLESGQFGAFTGQGFLRWNPDKGIEISALTNGGEALSRDFFAHLQMPVGTLVPPNAYLRLTATTRNGDSIASERLRFVGYDTYSSHDTVVWTIDRSQMASAVDFTKGIIADKVESVTFLLSNGEGVVWPRVSPSGQWCLQCQTTLGKVTAYAIPGGNVLINVDSDTPQELSTIIDAVGFAFCFWAGKILPILAYEARSGDSVCCRLYPLHKLNTSAEAPPFGHVISLELETFHEVLLQRAMDFFATDNGEIGPLIHTRLSCPDAPFSVGILVLCSALEGMVLPGFSWVDLRLKRLAEGGSADAGHRILPADIGFGAAVACAGGGVED